MFKAVFAFSVFIAGPVWAGCTPEGGEPGPVAEICSGSVCKIARLETVCSNASSAQFVYDNGTTFILTGPESSVGEGVQVVSNGVEMVGVTCRPVDENACPPVKP